MKPIRETICADEGMSLIEVLVTIVVGMLVFGLALDMMTGGFSSSARVQNRVEAAQSGRLLHDRLTTLLQSQVCNADLSPIISATTQSVKFYANDQDKGGLPTQHEIAVAGSQLVLRRWTMDPTPDATTERYSTTSVSPTIERTLLRFSSAPPASFVIFKFYGADPSTGEPVELNPPLTAGTAPLVTPVNVGDAPLPLTDARRVLRIDIDLWTDAERSTNSRQRTRMQTRSYTGSNIDPRQLEKGPRCATA